MSSMEREIEAQPHVLEGILRREERIAEVAQALRERAPVAMVLVARGTSDHAAIYGRYLFEYLLGIPCALGAPSVVSLYRRRLKLERIAVVALSQSGQAEDVGLYLEEARRGGALTIAITNDPASPLARLAHFHLAQGAGKERSIAATKTYTSQLFLLLYLAVLVAGAYLKPLLRQVPSLVREAIARMKTGLSDAGRFRFATGAIVLGRGLNTCTALEWALKLREVSLLSAQGFSAADFYHGPIAMLRPDVPVFCLCPQDRSLPFMKKTVRDLRGKGADVTVFSSREDVAGCASHLLPESHELLSPLLYAIPGQILALRLAEAKGFSPDHPPFLQKVTKTV